MLVCAPWFLQGLRVEADASRVMPYEDPLALSYRENSALFGEANRLVIELRYGETSMAVVNEFTDRLAETLEAWDDIRYLDYQPFARGGSEEFRMGLRAALLNSEPAVLQDFISRFEERGMRRELLRTRKRLIAVDGPGSQAAGHRRCPQPARVVGAISGAAHREGAALGRHRLPGRTRGRGTPPPASTRGIGRGRCILHRPGRSPRCRHQRAQGETRRGAGDRAPHDGCSRHYGREHAGSAARYGRDQRGRRRPAVRRGVAGFRTVQDCVALLSPVAGLASGYLYRGSLLLQSDSLPHHRLRRGRGGLGAGLRFAPDSALRPVRLEERRRGRRQSHPDRRGTSRGDRRYNHCCCLPGPVVHRESGAHAVRGADRGRSDGDSGRDAASVSRAGQVARRATSQNRRRASRAMDSAWAVPLRGFPPPASAYDCCSRPAGKPPVGGGLPIRRQHSATVSRQPALAGCRGGNLKELWGPFRPDDLGHGASPGSGARHVAATAARCPSCRDGNHRGSRRVRVAFALPGVSLCS